MQFQLPLKRGATARGLALFACLLALSANSQEVQSKMPDQPELTRVADGLHFPEGPAYNGKGNIYCSNCNADYVTKVTADGAVSIAYRANESGDNPFTFKKTNGMTFFRDGSLFICDFGRNAIVQIHSSGRQEEYVGSFEGHPFEAPNDLAFDPHGNLYFTAPGNSGREHPIGPIYFVESKSRKVTKVAEHMAFPNGLAFNADARSLYVCESQYNRIVRFEVHRDGTLGALQPFADLSSDGPGEPDGMAVDTKGNLWIAHFGAHTVLVVNSEGKIVRTIQMPHGGEGGPTNVEFAGKDMKTLYITDPGTSAMYRMRTDTPGLSLFSSPPNTGP